MFCNIVPMAVIGSPTGATWVLGDKRPGATKVGKAMGVGREEGGEPRGSTGTSTVDIEPGGVSGTPTGQESARGGGTATGEMDPGVEIAGGELESLRVLGELESLRVSGELAPVGVVG